MIPVINAFLAEVIEWIGLILEKKVMNVWFFCSCLEESWRDHQEYQQVGTFQNLRTAMIIPPAVRFMFSDHNMNRYILRCSSTKR